MMRGLSFVISATIFISLFMVGCSQTGVVPPVTQPGNEIPLALDEPVENRDADSQRVLWGMWIISFDQGKMEMTVEPVRNAHPHFNITNMVIPPACDDCVEFAVNSFDTITRIIDVDVTLTNPYAITGYDVRGILYTNDYGHLLTNALGWTNLWDVPGGKGLNPFKGFYTGPEPAAFGPYEERTENYLVYIPKPPQYNQITFAVGASWPTKCKEPYGISFFSHDSLYDYIGATAQAQVSVFDWQDDVDLVSLVATEITGEAFTHFTYAAGPIWQVDVTNNTGAAAGEYEARIIASSAGDGDSALYQYVTITVEEWAGPIVTGIAPDSGEPPETLVGVVVTGEQFAGPGAGVKLIPESGSDISATSVVVVDENIITCDIMIPEDAYVGLYGVEVTNGDSLSSVGPDLFEVTCPYPAVSSIDPNEGKAGEDLTNVTIVGDNFWGALGAVKLTLAGKPDINATNVFIDDYNTIYCDISIPPAAKYGWYNVEVENGCGANGGTTNMFEVLPAGWVATGFDSGDSRARAAIVDSNDHLYVVGQTDDEVAFFVWLDLDGELVLKIEWGDGTSPAKALGIALDAGGNIYIVGEYWGTIDFDHSSGTDNHTSAGMSDAFLISLDNSAGFRYARTWGSTSFDDARGVTVISDKVCVCGSFRGTVDFDPGSGTDELTSNGLTDAYLSRFDLVGGFAGIGAWGSTGPDYASGVAEYNNNIYVTGLFQGTVDFDPLFVYEEWHTSEGGNDAYLSKFDSSATHQWTAAWGGTGDERGDKIAADAGGVYVTGDFEGSVIFDPMSDDPADAIDSNGIFDIYLSKFLANGQYEWTDIFGGTNLDYYGGISLDPVTGEPLLTGGFRDAVDFDPGPGVKEITSIGFTDAFVCRLNTDGDLVWVSTWGSDNVDSATWTTFDQYGGIYVAGFFKGIVDFDPGPYTWSVDSLGDEDYFILKLFSNGLWYE